MPSRRDFEPRVRSQRGLRMLVSIAGVLSLVVLATAAGVARAGVTSAKADPISAADDQYGQQQVLTPPAAPEAPTPAPQALQAPAPQAPVAQGSTAPTTAAPPTPATKPNTPVQTTTPPPTPKSAVKAPLTPPKVPVSTKKVPLASKPQTSAAPATPAAAESGPALPFTGISLLDVVLVGLGLIALGAVLRRPGSRRH